MKTSATRAFPKEIVAMCTVGIISARAKRAFNPRRLNFAFISGGTTLNYTEATEMGPLGGGDDGARGILLSAYCLFPCRPMSAIPESLLLAEVISTEIFVNGMSRILEG
jgi:hypothetical protein